MPDNDAAAAAGEKVWPRLRGAFTKLGMVSLAAVVASVILYCIALSQGVHCLHCDRFKLGDRYAWWDGYFTVMGIIWCAGAAGGLGSLLLAKRRRWGAVAFGLAMVAVTLMPM